jgi:outer membrane protein assembly factor BamB
MSGEVVAAPAESVSKWVGTEQQGPRVWPAGALVGLFWAYVLVSLLIEMPIFVQFVMKLAAVALLLLVFAIWWATNGRIRRADRVLAVAAALVGGALAALLAQNETGKIAWLLATVPCLLTAWAVWLLLARRASARTRRVGLIASIVATWGAFTLIRMDGLQGDGQVVYGWRWSATPEELYLAERAQRARDEAAAAPRPSQRPLVLGPGDWPGLRGPNRNGVVRGARIAGDWNASPPTLLWRQRIGPGWSSMVIVGDRLFTQEQRGESEVVVCLEASTGRELWAHSDRARFSDGQAGAGPRATPTFANNRVYALGATGILNCLDAATGARKWGRDLQADSGAKAPLWGFSSSPLVAQGMVVVFAGGDGEKGLLAYHAESGRPAWTAAAGRASYSSPQLASIGGEPHLLYLSDRGLTAVAPASGARLWEHGASERRGMPPSLQPHLVGKTQVLIASETEGTVLLDLGRAGRSWAPVQRWGPTNFKPRFNDFVVHQGFVYGFDGAIFCCLDLQDGQRRWKRGRYGHGQVLLLAEQGLLLVVSERGAAILVAASPDGHQELGRFQAITGKTWNHPAIAHGRLYVRNGVEIACYDLGSVGREEGKIANQTD